MPEFALSVDTSKFSFASLALYLQKQLSAEIRLWRSFEGKEWPERLLYYFGTQVTCLGAKILKKGFNVELLSGLKLNLAPQKKIESPQQDLKFDPLKLNSSDNVSTPVYW